MDMMLFDATNRITRERKVLSDRQIDAGRYDLREWNIVPRSEPEKGPYMVLQVIVKKEDGTQGLTYFPVFHPSDLAGLRISTSLHLYTEDTLTEEQKFWLDSTLEASRWGLVLN